MTLQERLLATAKELIRLLEESQKEHEEMIRERDRKLRRDRAHYCNEVRRTQRLEKRLRADAEQFICLCGEAEAKDQAFLSALGMSDK